jgi:hypothetical protein
MNAPEQPRLDWTTANQRMLAAEFARLKARLRGEDESVTRDQYEQASAELETPAAIDRIAELFGLSGFERDVLLLAAGVEMDSELAGLCAQASAGLRPWATFGLALAVMPDPHWSTLAPPRPLRRLRLIETTEEISPVTGRLRVDERVLHYLAGINYLEPRLQPLLRLIDEPDVMAASQQSLAETIKSVVQSASSPLPMLQLPGADDDGKRDVAAYAARRLGLHLYAIAGDDLPASAHELEVLSALWQREAALLDAALLIECGDSAPSPSVKRFSEQVGGVILIAARSAMTLARPDWRFQVDKPDLGEQQDIWRKSLGSDADVYGESLDAVSSEFRLSARDIRRASAELARPRSAPDEGDGALWQICRGLQGRRLDGLAQRIEPMAGWDDLILPESQKVALRHIAAHQRHRATVYERWGFAGKGARGLGLSALFAGESGTGKTMAAEVLAKELHLDLYRIDLSAVVSKYIGETEKNLARLFDAAEDSGIILLFDEADALFGKRSEVKDSHDRYANIEVSYLLQRMEAYRGLAILTSNQKAALDTAFHRRLRFVINFPFPEAGEREAIWRSVFPPVTPTEGLDYAKLARLQMAGGSIRNIALNAAFLAAEESHPVTMAHILRAAQSEAGKRDRPLSDAETRGWV